MMHICSTCGEEIPLRQFTRTRPDGSLSLVRVPGPQRCEVCREKWQRQYQTRYKRVWRTKRRVEKP